MKAYLAPDSPEPQPAERLCGCGSEPLINRSFNTLGDLEAVLAKRCCLMLDMKEDIRARINFHW